MKTLIKRTEYKRVEIETDVNIPETQMYLWHNGIRRAYSVKPKWTSWNIEHNNKPEEIYTFDVVMVDPSDNKIEAVEITVSSLAEILNNEKHPYHRLVDNILNYPDDKEYIRTKEQFESDLQRVLQKINDCI